MPEQRQIHISTGIVFSTILILLALYFLYLILDIIALLFISVIIVSAMEPMINFFQKKKVPRSISVLGVYILIFAAIGIGISFLIPPIANEFQEFSKQIPEYFSQTGEIFNPVKDFMQRNNLDTGKVFENVNNNLANLTQNIFSTTVGFFSGFFSAIVVLSLTFYMAVEEDAISKFIRNVTPGKHQEYAVKLAERIKKKIGKWLLGQLFLMFIIFLLVWLGLALAGVPHALMLAVFAGIMEIIPYVGPIVAAVPGVILGFLVSPTVGFLALLVYLVSQQIENHIIVPQIMRKAVGLNPITVIVVLLIGAKLAGALGAILAIPVATAVSIFLGDLMGNKE